MHSSIFTLVLRKNVSFCFKMTKTFNEWLKVSVVFFVFSMSIMYLPFVVLMSSFSIILGVSIGIMGHDEVSVIRNLVITMAFHQFFEGVGLGAVISYLQEQLRTVKVVGFAFIFSITMPIGICIGLAVANLESHDSKTHMLITGCFEAFSAGTLLYVGLVEMLAEQISSLELKSKHRRKLGLVLSFVFGMLAMALIALGEGDAHSHDHGSEHDHEHDHDAVYNASSVLSSMVRRLS